MPPLISLFLIFSRFWAMALVNNQFSTMEFMNSLFSSLSKYNRVFNSLLEPCENGTSMALVHTHTQVIKTKDPMNMPRPSLENPVWFNSNSDYDFILSFRFCFYWANKIALSTFFFMRLTFLMAVWASIVIPLTACEPPSRTDCMMFSKSFHDAIWFVSSIWLSSCNYCCRVPSKFSSLLTMAGFAIMNFSIYSGVLSLLIFMFLRNLF